MKTGYGNLGLAAAAYNAGENRVSRWLNSGGFLPMETESYVFDIMGEPADKFTDAAHAGDHPAARPKNKLCGACRRLPVMHVHNRCDGVDQREAMGGPGRRQFPPRRRDQSVAEGEGRYPALLAGYDPVVSRVRTPIGRRGIYAVRIGVDNRANANVICQQLQSIGGFCVVVRNR